jgi:hypothetical protein
MAARRRFTVIHFCLGALTRTQDQTEEQILRTLRTPRKFQDDENKEWFPKALKGFLESARPGDIFPVGDDGFVVREAARR